MPTPAFTILTATLLDGHILAWVEGDGDDLRPVTYSTRDEAEAELADDRGVYADQVARGERAPEDVPDADEDEVVACLVHADGVLEIPAYGYHWTLADIRAQRGMD